jgi:hypothetical protein
MHGMSLLPPHSIVMHQPHPAPQLLSLPPQQAGHLFQPQQQQQQQQAPMLPPIAWELLPRGVCDALAALMQQRPTLAASLQDPQGIVVMAGLSPGGQQQVLASLWGMPVPPIGGVIPGLLQMLCSAAA